MAFKVHPDISHLQNATELMKKVNYHKNNPIELIKFAAKWGIDIKIPDEYKDIFEKAKSGAKKSFTEEEAHNIYDVVVNAVVKWYYRYQFKMRVGHGIVSKIRKIKKGKYKGQTEWTVMDMVSGKVKKIKGWTSPFIVEKIADENAIKVAKALMNTNAIKANEKKERKKEYYAKKFNEMGLKPNHNYEYDNVKVRVRYRIPKLEKLIKTTNFCVFHMVESTGKVRRTDLKFIIDAVKVDTYA